MAKVIDKEAHWLELRKYEMEYWAEGYNFVMGTDGVGCGPIAGPTVAAAVILGQDFKLLELRDSKAATKRMREKWSVQIKEEAICWSIAQVETPIIDQINIFNASLLAMDIARQKLTIQPDIILVDGRHSLPNSKHIPQKAIIRGDVHSAVIASASVIAKVFRDQIMVDYSKVFPEYGFEKHKGYCTKQHMDAVRKYGPCPIHRESFLGFLHKYDQMSIFDMMANSG